MQHEITSRHPLLDENGHLIEAGYARSMILDYDRMADDALYLLKRLKIRDPHIAGFSDGGIVALSMALYDPGLPKSLVLIGANLSPGGIKAGARLSMLPQRGWQGL